MTSVLFMVKKPQVEATARAKIEAFHRNFAVLVTDSAAWKMTVSRNANMACFKNGTGASCPLASLQPFDLYDASVTLVYKGVPGPSAAPPYNAFSFPSAQCPLQFVLMWAALDQNPYPLVAITATLRIGRNFAGNSYVNFVLNPAHYSYSWPSANWSPKSSDWPLAPENYPPGIIYRNATN